MSKPTRILDSEIHDAINRVSTFNSPGPAMRDTCIGLIGLAIFLWQLSRIATTGSIF